MTTKLSVKFLTRSDRHRLAFEVQGPTRTKESFAEQCDINRIMSRYKKTGLLTHVRDAGRFEDLPDSMDYQEAMNLVLQSQRSFAMLDAQLRARFENDPQRLLAFLENPGNRKEAEELGLVKPQVLLEPEELSPKASPASASPPSSKS